MSEFTSALANAFRVEDVAEICGMSASAFYSNFQAVTAMSPIQFQKQIRLQEARLQLAASPNDVAGLVSAALPYAPPAAQSFRVAKLAARVRGQGP